VSVPIRVDDIDWLASDDAERELSRMITGEPLSPKSIIRLRQRVGSQHASALLYIAKFRPKAIDKWGPGRWLVTDRGIQQATDPRLKQAKH